ncbi:MAG TPA: tRNA (cytosine(32)/uridine(32)-2'-O)-methyltransferase TrmJ [Gammaproteobacteria bacterium]|nr:tRNA (cytosine(32)/uridine(32)-2'-O)-methyltransferase TrmJ [Gammaproteobacteria bacterium]
MLARIRVILSNTSHPGNIGAAARAMKTMGLTRLVLVDPKHFPDAEATARASGADDVLAGARQESSIDAALAGCRLIMGASARSRSISCPVIDPAECAGKIHAESLQGDVAVLFGCEQNGLSNEEIDRCHFLVQIPTNPVYGSLNLASAVQIICYEIRVAHLVQAQGGEEAVPHVASADEMERFYAHLEQVLVDLDFLDPGNPRQLMRRLRRLFNRARPDDNEINILRGILSAAAQRQGIRP